MSFRPMPRRWLSLLALLLLVLSAQAAADGDDDDDQDDDRDDGGKDGKRKGKDRDHGDRDAEDRDDDDEKDDDKDQEGDDRKGKGGKGNAPRRGGDLRASRAQDASLRILPTALPGRVQFSFLVAGGPSLEPLALSVDLPDVGGAWTIAGPGAPSCDLDGRQLSCDLGGLAAGEVPLLQASAPVGR